jgi:hypothetical protein
MISDMKLRDKFMTVCGGCDGTGEYEEPIGGFENSVTYKTTQCDCENGKELDWQKVDEEIFKTKESIELVNSNIKIYNDITREYLQKDLNDLCIHALKGLVRYENELERLQTYLAELEIIE